MIPSLYVLKALCAYGVVILHAPIGACTEALRLIAAIAVPIFFMITGYFLFVEDRGQLGYRLNRSIRKIALVVLIMQGAMTLISLDALPRLGSWILWFKWLLLGQHYVYTYGHLWYLTALLETLILFRVIYKLGKEDYIPFLSLLWGLKVFMEDYGLLVAPGSLMALNAAFYAIPCVAFGYTIGKYRRRFLELPALKSLLLLSFALVYVVHYLLPDGETWQVLLMPFVRTGLIVFSFLCALKYSDIGGGTRLEYIGRSLSGNIYYWHGVWIVFTVAVLPSEIYDVWGAVCVAALSTGFARVVVMLQEKVGVTYLP